MADTARFRINAEGFIHAEEVPKIAIRPRYPLAPPCPTEAYNPPIRAKSKQISQNSMNNFTQNPAFYAIFSNFTA
jgi:hypothetical protein